MPLEGVATVAQAAAELRRLQTQREANDLPVTKRTPKFCDYVKDYFACFELVKDAKREAKLKTERAHLNQWGAFLGETRLDRITKAIINRFIAKRQGEGLSGCTLNLCVTVLRNVLNRAIDGGCSNCCQRRIFGH